MKPQSWIMLLTLGFIIWIANPFEHYILSWDVFGYYLYLPAIFIHHDLFLNDLSSVEQVLETYKNAPALYQVNQTLNGNVIRYPIGMALLYFPFFILGHFSAWLLDFPMDGFSAPYNFWINISSLVYVLAGILLSYRAIRIWFKPTTSIITLLLVYLGTNLFHSITETWGMPHIYLFAFYSALIIVTHNWLLNPNWRNGLLLGLVLGLMVVARPSEVVAVFIPLLMGIERGWMLQVIKIKNALIKSNYASLLGGIIPVALQLVYWKISSGSFFFDSYNNSSEGFDFLSPHTTDYLFSFRKGWLIYTPMAAFLLSSTVWALVKKKSNALTVAVYMTATIYLLSSWSTWWYGDGFSQRSIVESLAVLLIPTAHAIDALLRSKPHQKGIVAVIVLSIVTLNLFQTWQVRNDIIHTSRMTKQAYLAVFGKLEAPPNYEELLSVDRFSVIFDSLNYLPVKAFNLLDKPSQLEDEKQTFSQKSVLSYQELTRRDHVWIENRITVSSINTDKIVLVSHFTHRGKTTHYRTKEIEFDHVVDSALSFKQHYLTPDLRSVEDEFVT